MSLIPDYTQRARRFASRYPRLSHTLTYINFWVLANLLLGMIIFLVQSSMHAISPLPVKPDAGLMLRLALFLGISFGSVQAFVDYQLDKNFFRRRSLGITFLLKTAVSLVSLLLLFALVRYVLYQNVIRPLLMRGQADINPVSWNYTLAVLVVYYAAMILIITFITQVNKKYGPGVLVPLLLGRYRQPREEERVFMFMDLQASTTLAESLGHKQYSSFIRDAIADINRQLDSWHAEVYQYVGDEVVVSWKPEEAIRRQACIRFYYACLKQFEVRGEYYRSRYGHVPFFKAGLHGGPVTAVEIGEIKRDIAYHGDTLNTAARIQGLCNTYGKPLLVSDYITRLGGMHLPYRFEQLGEVALRGKQQMMALYCVEAGVGGE